MASADPAPRLWRRLSSAGAGAQARQPPLPELKAGAPTIAVTGPSTSSSTKLAAAAAVAVQPAPDEAADNEPLIKAAYPGRVSTQQAPDSSNSVINSPRGAPAELPQLQPRRPPPPPPAAHSNAAARPRQVPAAAGVQPFRFERLG